MTVTLEDIHRNIAASDTVLNDVIQDYLDGDAYFGESMTVSQWRAVNWQLLRRMGSPELMMFIDAWVMKNSPNPDRAAEGLTLMTAFCTQYEAVMDKFQYHKENAWRILNLFFKK